MQSLLHITVPRPFFRDSDRAEENAFLLSTPDYAEVDSP